MSLMQGTTVSPSSTVTATICANDRGRDDAAGIHDDASAGNAGDAIPGNSRADTSRSDKDDTDDWAGNDPIC